MHSLAIENCSPSILVSHMNILRDFDQISLWDYWWEIKFILHYYCRLSVQNYLLPNACKPTGARNRPRRCQEVQHCNSIDHLDAGECPASSGRTADTATVRDAPGRACAPANSMLALDATPTSLGIRLRDGFRSPLTRHVGRHADKAFVNGAAADRHFTLGVDCGLDLLEN